MREAHKERFALNAQTKMLPKPFNIDNIVRVNQKGQAATLEMVSPRDAQALVSQDARFKFLDVRSPLEFSEVHIKDAKNIPIDALASKIDELNTSGDRYIVLCRTGNRSPMAADMILQSGAQGVKVMQGGMTRWQKDGLSVIKGKSVISLERQVRTIAGSLMLFGIIMAWLVHKAFIFVSVWVACGLIFAGITNSCLMGMLLMKLPYNKKMYQPKTGGGTCSISQ